MRAWAYAQSRKGLGCSHTYMSRPDRLAQWILPWSVWMFKSCLTHIRSVSFFMGWQRIVYIVRLAFLICNTVFEFQHIRMVNDSIFLSKLSIFNTAFDQWLIIVACSLQRGRSGSVVEYSTQDRRAAGSSLTGVTVLCP